MAIKRKITMLANKKRSLEDFITSPDHNSYVDFNGLHSYVRKARHFVDDKVVNTLDRANTTNKARGRGKNIKFNPKHKKTGLYKQFDDHMHDMARKHGFDGVYVECVQNHFLPNKLKEYGYKQVESPGEIPGGPPSFYKSSGSKE